MELFATTIICTVANRKTAREEIRAYQIFDDRPVPTPTDEVLADPVMNSKGKVTHYSCEVFRSAEQIQKRTTFFASLNGGAGSVLKIFGKPLTEIMTARKQTCPSNVARRLNEAGIRKAIKDRKEIDVAVAKTKLTARRSEKNLKRPKGGR